MALLLADVTVISLSLVCSPFASFSVITKFSISSLLCLTVWTISWNVTRLLAFKTHYISFSWTTSLCIRGIRWTVIGKMTRLLTFIAYRISSTIFCSWTFLILKITSIWTFWCYMSWLFAYITDNFSLTSLLIFRRTFSVRTSGCNMARLFAYMANNSFFLILKMSATFLLYIYPYIIVDIL